MARYREAPCGFLCPYRNRCPHLEELSTHWVFREYQRAIIQEQEHWRTREDMTREIDALQKTIREQDAEIDRLRAENRRLHQRGFKARPSKTKTEARERDAKAEDGPKNGEKQTRRRGAPEGHPPWTRKTPASIDRIVEVDAPCACPHCREKTDLSRTDATSYIQEDIVHLPQIIVTEFRHATAWCPACRRQVFRRLEGELPFAPIGPRAKAAALYLRHELKLPYRKIRDAMGTLFGLDFVPASTLGFEQKARANADPLYTELIEKLRVAEVVHADETHWRQDGENGFVWYAGNPDLALFHIDPHRSAEAAQVLLGDRLDALLVADAYAGYNRIEVRGRQGCLAHLVRKAQEGDRELDAMKNPDPASRRFCQTLGRLFGLACRVAVPKRPRDREQLARRFQRALALVCETPLEHPKAETLRKRLVPGAREHDEVFAFILHDGPPTNNHAERALRPLVIFRKVCMGTRSLTGSENIAVFSSLTQTSRLQGASLIDLFAELLTGSPASAQDVIFNDSG
jgi:transposase